MRLKEGFITHEGSGQSRISGESCDNCYSIGGVEDTKVDIDKTVSFLYD